MARKNYQYEQLLLFANLYQRHSICNSRLRVSYDSWDNVPYIMAIDYTANNLDFQKQVPDL